MKRKRIAARKFATKYLIIIALITLAIATALYATYALYLSLGALILIAYILARQPRLIYYTYRLIRWIYRPFTSRYRTWNQGAEGEELVAKTLDQLGNDYAVIHDIMLPEEKGNIDHLVIGENGIFIIETKNHKGSINCIGDAWVQHRISRKGEMYENAMGSPSKQVKGKTIAVKKFLQKHYPQLSNIWITPIIVFANKETTVETFKPTVDVLKPEDITIYIRNYKARIPISSQDAKQLATLLNKTQTQ